MFHAINIVEVIQECLYMYHMHVKKNKGNSIQILSKKNSRKPVQPGRSKKKKTPQKQVNPKCLD